MTPRKATVRLVCMVCMAEMNNTPHAKAKHLRETGHSPTREYRLVDDKLAERKA